MNFSLIFYIGIMFITICFVLSDFETDPNIKVGIRFIFTLIILFLWASIVFRAPSGDMGRYLYIFEKFSTQPLYPTFGLYHLPILFNLFSWVIAQISITQFFTYTIIFIIIYFFCYKAFRNIFNFENTAILMICYSMYPFFVAYTSSGIREGFGLAFMTYGISKLITGKKMQSFFWLYFATFWHYGLWLPVIILMPAFFLRQKQRLYIVSWLVFICSIILSMANVWQHILSRIGGSLSSVQAAGYQAYFNSDAVFRHTYRTGFRLDFFLFSIIPVIIYLVAKSYFREEYKDRNLLIISIYMLLNSLTFLFSFMVSSDRFASFSWFIWLFVVYSILYSLTNKYTLKIFIFLALITNIFFLNFYLSNYLIGLKV
jgi:hypothetical protein